MMIQEIAPHSFHIEYRRQLPDEQDILLIYRGNMVLLEKMETGEFRLPIVSDARRVGILSDLEECRYLFEVDNTVFFTIPEKVDAFKNFHYENTSWLRQAHPVWKAFAAITGFQIWSWYEKNIFCGRCGQKMIHSDAERSLCCSSCGMVSYPVIAPSVIVAVIDGDRMLLTRYQAAHSAYRNYALIAGYTETGEMVEDTVRREVMEEVGLQVKNIRYYKSQPWSFSGTLLLGFFCEVDGDTTIRLDETELEEAVWMKRDKLPDRSKDISLTSEMMELFRRGNSGL